MLNIFNLPFDWQPREIVWVNTRILLPIASLAFAAFAQAAPSGSDNASDPAYSKEPAWSGGENGGRGFLGWNLVGNGEPASDRGFFIASSAPINSNIDSVGGKAFGIFAKGKGVSAEAYRSFSAPLEAGQSFSVDLAVNFRSGLKGIDLRTPASDGERVIFNFNIGAEDYVVNKAATGNGSIGSTYSAQTAFKITFRQTSPTGGTWTVTRSGGMVDESTGTYEGVAAGVKFYVAETEGGKENDLWVNNLEISGPAGN